MIKILALLLGSAKLGKLLLVVGSMVLSIWAYSLLFGWVYAVGFVALIFVHEMGHFVAARQKGLAVGAPVFIPFVGAWVALKETPMNVETEAYVAMAGPLVGTFGALVCYFLAREYDNRLLLALSYAGFFINLFNLIPLAPFDGGRVTSILSPRMWLVGVPILIGLFLWRPSPLLVVMAILAAPQSEGAQVRPRRAGKCRLLCRQRRNESHLRHALYRARGVPRRHELRHERDAGPS